VLLAVITLASVGKVVTFLVMLSVLIVLHEYGHFICARRNGVRVNEFSVGMGPKLAGWKSPRSGTQYSLRILPIGGYCAMEGEDGKTSEAEQQREFRASGGGVAVLERPKVGLQVNFQAKTAVQRLTIVLAGPVANFILTFVILLIAALAFGVPSEHPAYTLVGPIIGGSPAQRAGLHEGDRILAVTAGKKRVEGGNIQLVDAIHTSLGKPVAITYERGNVTRTVQAVPVRCPDGYPKNFGCIGFTPQTVYEHVPVLKAVTASFTGFAAIADQVVMSLVLLVSHFTTYAPQVSGVIGMGQAAGEVQDLGWGPYCQLAAIISFALGLFNLLPLPALDGGRAAFIVAELLRGKPVDPEREALVHIAGFAALMALMLIVAAHDIARIVSGQGVF
jgi:regulator of sigma E protease